MEPNFENIIQLMLSTNINLTQQSCVAVLSTLWNEKTVCKCIKLILLQEIEEPDMWSNIENYIFLSIEKILLPNYIKLNMKNILQPMRIELLNWTCLAKRVFQSFPDFRVKINFVWTGKGTLDHVQTIKRIIDQNPSNQDLCFCLACVFCIEEAALRLEPCVYLPFVNSRLKRSGSVTESYFVATWARNLSLTKGLCESGISFNNFSIDNDELDCLCEQNIMCVSAVKYFLEILSPVKKRKMLLHVLRSIFYHKKPHSGNVLLLLFPYLEKNKVNHFFRHFAFDILFCFLEWPHQEFFMLVANSIWNYLSEFQYLDLFMEISNRISQFNLSNIYTNLIEEFWLGSPPAFKKHIIHKCMSRTLNRLFFLQNTDRIIQMILKECIAQEKQEIIFLAESMFICDGLVKLQRWESLQLFILSCVPAQDVLKNFIHKFEKRQMNFHGTETELFDIFIDKLVCWSKEYY